MDSSYYPRITNGTLGGRVTRLLVTPLLKTFKKVLGHRDYLEFIDVFRYPLAGEFSFRSRLLKEIRIPCDWGLEIGLLSEMQRNQAWFLCISESSPISKPQSHGILISFSSRLLNENSPARGYLKTSMNSK